MKTYALALLLLVIHSAASDAAGTTEPGSKAQSDAEKYARPVSEGNPFGIDYGFHPIAGLASPQGIPTRQLSMFHGQILFAESKCTTTPKPTKSQRVFHNFFVGVHDQDFNKPYKIGYAKAVGEIRDNYQNAWDGMDEAQRSEFCAEYWSDIGRLEERSSLLARASLYEALTLFYLGALSPLSSESIEEVERKARAREDMLKALGPILLVAQVLALAGGLSAGTDALAAQRAGQYSLAQARYAQSSNLLRLGSAMSGAGVAALSNAEAQAVPDPMGQEYGCHALDHFDQYAAEPDSDVWKKFQRLTTNCEALQYLRERRPPAAER